MPETVTTARDRRTAFVLAIVCVLLALVIAFLLVHRFASPSVTPGTAQAPASETATPTVVPAEETPEQFIGGYFDAVIGGDYEAAYERLPADKRAEQDLESFSASLEGYGITGYSIDGVSSSETTAQVLVTASMPAGTMQYVWTFERSDDDWVLVSRGLGSFAE